MALGGGCRGSLAEATRGRAPRRGGCLCARARAAVGGVHGGHTNLDPEERKERGIGSAAGGGEAGGGGGTQSEKTEKQTGSNQ